MARWAALLAFIPLTAALGGCLGPKGPCWLGQVECENLGDGEFRLRGIHFEQTHGITWLWADRSVRHLLLEDVDVKAIMLVFDPDCACTIAARNATFTSVSPGSDMYWSWGRAEPVVTYQGLQVKGFASTRISTGHVHLDGVRIECGIGEGIDASGGSLTVTGMTISKCDYGIEADSGSLMIRNSTFEDNRSGVYVWGNRVPVVLSNVTFRRNENGLNGGVGAVDIRSSRFVGNEVGISASGGNLTIEDTRFEAQSRHAIQLTGGSMNGTRLAFHGNGPACDDCGAIVGDFQGAIHGSSFEDNGMAIMLGGQPEPSAFLAAQSSLFQLNATENWWGDAFGPSFAIDGVGGDHVGGAVKVYPHLRAPP